MKQVQKRPQRRRTERRVPEDASVVTEARNSFHDQALQAARLAAARKARRSA